MRQRNKIDKLVWLVALVAADAVLSFSAPNQYHLWMIPTIGIVWLGATCLRDLFQPGDVRVERSPDGELVYAEVALPRSSRWRRSARIVWPVALGLWALGFLAALVTRHSQHSTALSVAYASLVPYSLTVVPWKDTRLTITPGDLFFGSNRWGWQDVEAVVTTRDAQGRINCLTICCRENTTNHQIEIRENAARMQEALLLLQQTAPESVKWRAIEGPATC